ncbi:TIGR02117 family protein [Flavobacterium sp.]|uniref:TIGR02117 family protein n=1 Tax=Flavobacterium sp. TaxID=239 RepID=UPI00260184EC|nr:TIGR02117 family protein [Flavobacterium sp.]MDD3005201.1 TIGR02117 family protein [Flavobacterium sp.]
MKKTLKFIGKSILGLLIFIVVYVFFAFAIPYIGVNKKHTSTSQDVEIYIKTNGVHTDIVVPIKSEYKDWSKIIQYKHIKSKDSTLQYIAFGWGDKGFYLNTPEWSDLKVSTALVAASGIGESAMHATFMDKPIEGIDCVKLKISSQEYYNLINYVESSFEWDKDKSPIWIDATTYGLNDSFYEAKGAYNLFYTCNTWSNNALKVMNQKAALWSVTDRGIFQQYQ